MLFYKYLFIFAIFSILGWILEVIYRGIVHKKIVNPGFMSGCVVPLYGMGAIILNFICILFSNINTNFKILILFVVSAFILTLLEFICGYISLKYFHIRLWDYRKENFNYKGFICLKFSIIWGITSIIYYLIVYPKIDSISLSIISSNSGRYIFRDFSNRFKFIY